MPDCCPHCGARLPATRDAFCGVCFNPIDEPPSPAAPAEENPIPPPTEAEAGELRAKARRQAAVLSLAIYACLVGVVFQPDVRAKGVQALGEAPFGLPVGVVMVAMQTLLFAPFPWVCYHLFYLIGAMSGPEGNPILGLGSLFSLLGGDSRSPHLARSKWICAGGVAYFLFVMFAWICCAGMLGI